MRPETARQFKTLAHEIRLYLAERLITAALKIVPLDHPQGRMIATAIYHLFKQMLEQEKKEAQPAASNPNGFPTYACGAFPRVGDLVEFGTQHRQYVVTAIQDTSGPYSIICGDCQFGETALKMMRLVARWGRPARRA